MNPTPDSPDPLLQAATLAIQDSDNRSQLLGELLTGLQAMPYASELIFGRTSALTVAAEHELLSEINRLRTQQGEQQEAGKKMRPRRPPMMRGLII